MNPETTERLARLNEYLAIAMRDPDNNREYIADLLETIAMLTPKKKEKS